MPVIVKCAWCGKEVKKVPAKVVPVNFCSRQCSGKYRQGKPFHSKETREMMSSNRKGKKKPGIVEFAKSRIGDKHPRWKGDSAQGHTGRHRAQYRFPLQPCDVCGVDPKEHRVHRHHKDGNTLNNSPENIAFLCTKHHGEAHRKDSK